MEKLIYKTWILKEKKNYIREYYLSYIEYIDKLNINTLIAISITISIKSNRIISLRVIALCIVILL